MTPRQPMREYLYFSRRDRIAVILLTVLIIIVWALPNFLSSNGSPHSGQDLGWISVIRDLPDSAKGESDQQSGSYPPARSDKYSGNAYNNARTAKLFSFDPNTLDRNGWLSLGLREKTVGTILNYRSKGGFFRTAGDLSKIYGLNPALAAELVPYVKLAGSGNSGHHGYPNGRRAPTAELPPDRSFPSRVVTGKQSFGPPTLLVHKKPAGTAGQGVDGAAKRPRAYQIVDVNESDTADWIALPAIGSRLAARIVAFRDKLGGFYGIEQVKETYGIADSVYRLIAPYLKLNPGALRQVAINGATLDELKDHPYIRYQMARTIISYRNQHGPFKSVGDLEQIGTISNEAFRKLKPYLRL